MSGDFIEAYIVVFRSFLPLARNSSHSSIHTRNTRLWAKALRCSPQQNLEHRSLQTLWPVSS